MNPFTILYLVQITLSAVVLSAGWTVVIAASSVAAFGALFLLPNTDHGHHASSGAHPLYGTWHLQGMWVAFLLAALLTTFFIGRIARAIAQQREQIAALREASARNARLAAITTLAAGAAHELGSPLGTIAVAAHEARIALDTNPDTQPICEDLNLILLEVERCREILGLMAARATDPDGTSQPLRLETLERELRERLGVERSARVELQLDFDAADLEIPPAPTLQSIVALVQNGLDATPAGEGIIVAVARRGVEVHIQVVDKGAGIPESVLARVGEPFFTTKPPGRGLGLGVFLARAFAESRGGELTIESTPGAGTRACLRIPLGFDASAVHTV
jgi:two-component system sensor histidine kinase RegB